MIWFSLEHTEAEREWFAGNVAGAVERYRALLARQWDDPQARAALVEIVRLLDETASTDAEFREARKALRGRIAHLLTASETSIR